MKMKKHIWFIPCLLFMILLSCGCANDRDHKTDSIVFNCKVPEHKSLQDSIMSFILDVGNTGIIPEDKSGLSVRFEITGQDTIITCSSILLWRDKYAFFADCPSGETLIYYYNFNPTPEFFYTTGLKNAKPAVEKWLHEVDDGTDAYLRENFPYSLRKYKYFPSTDSLSLIDRRLGKFEANKDLYAILHQMSSKCRYSDAEIEEFLMSTPKDELSHDTYVRYKTNEILYNCLRYNTGKLIRDLEKIDPETRMIIYASIKDGPLEVSQNRYLPVIKTKVKVLSTYHASICSELLFILIQ